jgi:O-antigen ligase
MKQVFFVPRAIAMPSRRKGLERLLGVLVLLAMLALAALIGIGGALVGWFGQLFLLSVLIPLALLAISYRFGLFALIMLMPFSESHFVPKVGPLSIINLLIVGVLGLIVFRLLLKRISGEEVFIPIERSYVLYYFIPITVGFLIGSMHLREIPSHLLEDGGRNASQSYYWVSTYFKGFLISICGLALGSVVVEHQSQKKIIAISIASAMIYVLVTAAMFATVGQSLEAAINSRQMFSATGRHANSVGAMLLPAYAVPLYLQHIGTSWVSRSLYRLSAVILFLGVLLTGSRGAFLGLMVITIIYIYQMKRVGVALLMVMFVSVALALAPDAITRRLSMGLENLNPDSDYMAAQDEKLTSGRLHLSTQLVPEILKSPLVGRGIGSTRWSDYAMGGGTIAHPHNLYLSIVLDLGLLGVFLLFVFVVYVMRLFRSISTDPAADDFMRMYFKGSMAGLIGFLVFGLGGGHPYPKIEMWFLWVSLGIAIGYKKILIQAGSDRFRSAKDVIGDKLSFPKPWRI